MTMPSNDREEIADSAKVLVVDDDHLQREEIADFLTRQGIDVSVADNGFAAVHEIRNTRPRVVIMDMRMPGLDGLHVSRLVKDLEYRPRIILVSGYPEYIYRAHAEEAEIFAVLEKPVPLQALIRFVNDALTQTQD